MLNKGYKKISNITQHYLSYTDDVKIKTYKLPMLHIQLINKTNSLKTNALVDSGASTTFVPKELADILDIDLTENPHDISAAGGYFCGIPTYVDKCQLIKNQKTIYEEFLKMRIMVPADDNTLPYMVLGRDYIFKSFKITFNENKQKIGLKRT